MIRVNLTQRIWLSFISLIVLVGLSIIIIYPISIKGTLTEETYRIIELEQARLNPYHNIEPPQSELDFIEQREAVRSVGHVFIINYYGSVLGGDRIPQEVLREMGVNALQQESTSRRYELTYGGATLFYIISKMKTADGEDVFAISYMWDTYRDQMVNKLWERLMYILLLTSALSLLPAIYLKHYLKQPLIILGNHFEQIAKRNWQEPFKWEGDEDFQKLSDQFEQMRQNLMRYDRAQKTFIQHASHELKTPIMVIKSYAQATKDSILPKENLEKTMDVIIQESHRMERRVKDMIYYTKLDSLKDEKPNHEAIVFGEIAFQIEERFRMQREDISFIIEGADVEFQGDYEQLQVILENFIENGLRYALSKIWIIAEYIDQEVHISVENDGEHIPDGDLVTIFAPFHKGNKGQFGLGLAIVKRIAELHGGYPFVVNRENGVRFTVVLPQKQDKRSLRGKKERN
ncbi:sensor histidine kinase [Bacillus alkalicellulosilyticus]|uniref:sensor histidine kinase n=1 Tax=Alkalihalobacterium alkalicellulosilyticum TaxID=1912214 RepID=UPI000996C224|nr:HAMP domain-containing sensor histidine kinase [Bacillus alkalicellulosilyticus]